MIVAAVVISHMSAEELRKQGYHGKVKCPKCGHEDKVVLQHALRTGFPEHCGETMHLDKEDSEPVPAWHVKKAEAEAQYTQAKEGAKALRCRRTKSILVDHGGFDLHEPYQCLLDANHTGDCTVSHREFKERFGVNP